MRSRNLKEMQDLTKEPVKVEEDGGDELSGLSK